MTLVSMPVLIYALCFLAAGFISVGLTWNVREVAKARGWTASPVLHRHVHKMPVPRLGGVAIYFTFLAGAVLLPVARALWVPDLRVVPDHVFRILIPGTLVFLVGLYLCIDFRSVRANKVPRISKILNGKGWIISQ